MSTETFSDLINIHITSIKNSRTMSCLVKAYFKIFITSLLNFQECLIKKFNIKNFLDIFDTV